MTIARRTLLAAAGGAVPATAVAAPTPKPRARFWRRIATEEAFWTPELAAMNRTLGQTRWTSPTWTSCAEPPTPPTLPTSG